MHFSPGLTKITIKFFQRYKYLKTKGEELPVDSGFQLSFENITNCEATDQQILFSITQRHPSFQIERANWVQWMKHTHIPKHVMTFPSIRIKRISKKIKVNFQDKRIQIRMASHQQHCTLEGCTVSQNPKEYDFQHEILDQANNQSNLVTSFHCSQFLKILSHSYYGNFFLTDLLDIIDGSSSLPFTREPDDFFQSDILKIQIQTCPLPAEQTLTASHCV